MNSPQQHEFYLIISYRPLHPLLFRENRRYKFYATANLEGRFLGARVETAGKSRIFSPSFAGGSIVAQQVLKKKIFLFGYGMYSLLDPADLMEQGTPFNVQRGDFAVASSEFVAVVDGQEVRVLELCSAKVVGRIAFDNPVSKDCNIGCKFSSKSVFGVLLTDGKINVCHIQNNVKADDCEKFYRSYDLVTKDVLHTSTIGKYEIDQTIDFCFKGSYMYSLTRNGILHYEKLRFDDLNYTLKSIASISSKSINLVETSLYLVTFYKLAVSKDFIVCAFISTTVEEIKLGLSLNNRKPKMKQLSIFTWISPDPEDDRIKPTSLSIFTGKSCPPLALVSSSKHYIHLFVLSPKTITPLKVFKLINDGRILTTFFLDEKTALAVTDDYSAFLKIKINFK